ncbi:hypothetical protein KCU64_g6732, partial [Aureobasidium melanogenum]
MALVKRPHDVISIHSDSSEDEEARLARPHKMARHKREHLAPIYGLDNWLEQHNMPGLVRTVSVKREGIAVSQAQAGALATPPQTIDSGDLDRSPPFQFHFNELPFAYEEVPDSQGDPIVITDTAPTPERSQFDRILEVVPDVSHDHVTQLLDTHHQNVERVLDILLDGKYPKESEKRAAEEAARQAALHDQKLAEEAEKEKLFNPHCIFSGKMKDVIIEVLKDEFNTIPVKFIKEVQKDKKHLYPTYLALNEAKHTDPCPYGKTPWRPLRDINFDLLQATKHQKANISVLKEQFESAQKAVIEINLQRRKSNTQKIKDEIEAAAKAREEQSALEHAKATGTVVDVACYDEYAPNKIIRCGSEDKHPVCLDCMKTYLESEVGQCSFKLVCPGGCDDTFYESQLRLVPDTDALTDKLMRLRQENDLRTAGIDDVEGCPFCDFKTVCLPISIDFEFHCQSPTCNITSCRKCKEETHIPDSCEENQRKRDKESALSHRHRIEEARSKALIRNCNKCKQAFIKSDGCNKMTCSQCGNLQCYLCGVDVTANYAHFNAPGSKCPVFSETISLDAMHEQEVNAAAEAAQAEVLREHPELDKNDLDIRFSDSTPGVEKHMPDVNQPRGVPVNQPRMPPINQPQPMWDDDFEHLLFRGEVARMRRLNRPANPHAARPALFLGGHAPNVPQAPAADLAAARQRTAADAAAAAQAARDRPDPLLAYNANAQQPNPARDGLLDAALGQVDFGFDAQAGAHILNIEEDDNAGYLHRPGAGWAAGNAFWPENRFQGFDWMMDRVPQAQVNMAPPVPGPALGAQDGNNRGNDYPGHQDMGFGYAW